MNNKNTCIFCNTEKAIAKLSIEHVFPEAIGGHFTLQNVCVDCNSKLGSDIDHYLCNNNVIKILCMELGIRGKDGKLPNPIHTMKTVDGNRPVRFFPDDNSRTGNIKYILTKNEEIIGNSRTITFTGDASEVDAALKKSIERLAKKGFVLCRSEKYVIEMPSEELKAHLKSPLEGLFGSLLKIAYELSHYWLGDLYTCDPMSEIIRNCIHNKFIDGINMDLRLFSNTMAISKLDIPNYCHAARIFSDGSKAFVEIRIFNVFECVVQVSDLFYKLALAESRTIIIDPLCRLFHEFSGDTAYYQSSNVSPKIAWILSDRKCSLVLEKNPEEIHVICNISISCDNMQ